MKDEQERGTELEQVEATIDIDRPAADVFAFVADVTNMPHWQPQIVETVRADPPALGATFEQRVQTPMRDVDSVGEVTAFEAGERFAITTEGGPLKTQATFDFSESGGTTTVSMQLRVDAVNAAFKLALPVVSRAMRKGVPENLATLKSLLEGDEPGA